MHRVPTVSRASEESTPEPRGPGRDALPLPVLPGVLRRSLNASESADTAGKPSPTAEKTGTLPMPRAVPTVESATGTVQRQADAAEAAPRAGSEPADEAAARPTDVNEMFRKLYPRVRDELRWELRVQRERAGMLSDPL